MVEVVPADPEDALGVGAFPVFDGFVQLLDERRVVGRQEDVAAAAAVADARRRVRQLVAARARLQTRRPRRYVCKHPPTATQYQPTCGILSSV